MIGLYNLGAFQKVDSEYLTLKDKDVQGVGE